MENLKGGLALTKISKKTNRPRQNHILAIAIDRYFNVTPLSNPIHDCQALTKLLTEKYTFEEGNITRIFDDKATRSEIYDAFENLKNRLTEQDNLLILFSGHGHWDNDINAGYWIPVNAPFPLKDPDLISKDDIIRWAKPIKALHIVFIVDCCFPGALLKGSQTTAANRLEEKYSRWVLASGRLEPVSDGMPGDNSPFVKALISELNHNREAKIRLSDLGNRVISLTANNANQTPICHPIPGLDDLGGEFSFHLKTTGNTIFLHEFFVDSKLYQPITETIKQLDEKIANQKGGYIFLAGSPGSGKSTLLTEWAKARKERTVRYYAFTKIKDNENLRERGEASTLLIDLILQLNSFREVTHYSPYVHQDDSIALQRMFFQQLSDLEQDFDNHGTPTFIIVDGLDHVPREYKPKHSFLNYLPTPDSIPDGVYIILGSQTFELADLNPNIKAIAGKTENCISISPLSEVAVFKFIDSFDSTSSFTKEVKRMIFEKSGGHPLYLTYLMQKLDGIPEINEDVVKAIEPYDQDIAKFYDKFWVELKATPELIEPLGLISRWEGALPLDFIREWGFAIDVIQKLRDKAGHFFEKTERNWSIFHNSFRQFLIEKTSIDPLTDKVSPQLHQTFYNRLAVFCERSSIVPTWEATRYLFEGGNLDRLLEAVDPDVFASQMLAFRPYKSIKLDINRALEAARQKHDAMLVAKYIFALALLETREFHFEPENLIEHLLVLGEYEKAKAYLWEGQQLLLKGAYPLKIAKILFDLGETKEAAKIFHLAEPEEVVNGEILLPPDNREIYDKMKVLSAWVDLAVLIVPLEKILVLAHNIRFVEGPFNRYWEEHHSASYVTARLLLDGGCVLADYQSWEKLDRLILDISNLPKEEAAGLHFHLLLNSIESAHENGLIEKALFYLNQLLSAFDFDHLKNKAKIYVLDWMFKLKFDPKTIKEKLKQIHQPKLVENPISDEREFHLFAPRIKLNKMLWAMGMPPSILEAVPDSEKENDELRVLFERRICLVASFIGKALSDMPQEPVKLRDFEPLISMYYEFNRNRRDHNDYWLKKLKADFYGLVIYAASLYGKDLLVELQNRFIAEFDKSPNYWSSETKREILLSFESYLAAGTQVQLHLEKLEETMLDEKDVSGRIDECISQAKAWVQLGEKEKALTWLRNAIQVSTGVGYRKDYQLNTWIDWMQKVNKIDPTYSRERISWLLARLGYIRESTEGNAYHYASEGLLKACFKWNVANGVEQLKWQLDNGLANFTEALSIFLENIVPIADETTFEILTQFFEKVFLLASEISGRDLIAAFAKRQTELKGVSSLQTYLERLAISIQIYALEEIRDGYFSALIEEADKAGIKSPSLNNLRKENEGDSNSSKSERNRLTLLPDHRSISQEDVLAQVDNYESFRSLFEQEDKANSSFDWTAILKKISSELTPTHLLEISKLPLKKYGKIERMGKFVELSIDLGFDEAAEQIAFKALELSRGTDWIDHWSGGWKRKILKSLTKVKGNEARKIALDFLVEDAKKDSNLSVTLAQILDDVLDVIQPNFDWKILWKYTFNYLEQLLSNAKPLENLPPLQRGEVSASDLTSELLWYLASYPAGIVTEACKRVILAAMIQGNSCYLKHCSTLLKSENDDQQELAIQLLSSLQLEKPNLLSSFKDDLVTQAISPNGFIRKHALSIFESAFPDVERTALTKQKLPIIYHLHLEESPKLELPTEVLEMKQQVRTVSPMELLEKLFGYQLEFLSEHTGFELANLKARAKQIMQNVTPKSSLQPDYESRVNKRLSAIDFEASGIVRPNLPIAEKTMVYLLTELMDADHQIAGEMLHRDVKFFDPLIHLVKPTVKPDIINRLSNEDEGYGIDKKKWLANIGDIKNSNHEVVFDDLHVIGEFTFISRLDWGIPTEIRKKAVYPSSAFQKEKPKKIVFGKRLTYQVNEYRHIGIDPPNIIIQNDIDHIPRLDWRAGWLALNPNLGYWLGWLPTSEGLFHWRNHQGELMAKSIYWQSGNLKISPPHMKSEPGEGWLVLMSENGIEELTEKLGDLIHIGNVQRWYQSEEEIYKEEIEFSQDFQL